MADITDQQLEGLTLKQLKDLRQRIDALIEKREPETLNEFRSKIIQLAEDMGVSKEIAESILKGAANPIPNPSEGPSRKKPKSNPVYYNPSAMANPTRDDMTTGRGPKQYWPSWFRQYNEEGGDLDEIRISKLQSSEQERLLKIWSDNS